MRFRASGLGFKEFGFRVSGLGSEVAFTPESASTARGLHALRQRSKGSDPYWQPYTHKAKTSYRKNYAGYLGLHRPKPQPACKFSIELCTKL